MHILLPSCPVKTIWEKGLELCMAGKKKAIIPSFLVSPEIIRERS